MFVKILMGFVRIQVKVHMTSYDFSLQLQDMSLHLVKQFRLAQNFH